jgi:hypothetical protein
VLPPNTNTPLIHRSTTDGTTHHDKSPSHNLQRDGAHTTPTLYDALPSLCTGRRYSPTPPTPRVRISRASRYHPKYDLELHNHRWFRNPHPTRGSPSEPHGIFSLLSLWDGCLCPRCRTTLGHNTPRRICGWRRPRFHESPTYRSAFLPGLLCHH